MDLMPSYKALTLLSSLALGLCTVRLANADPPPFANASLRHITTGDDFLLGTHGSKYDPNGSFDPTVGRIDHNAFAMTWGVGQQEVTVTDGISVPFRVSSSGLYNVQVSGRVTGGIWSVGIDIVLPGSQWGDFDVSLSGFNIFSATRGFVGGSGGETILSRQTTLWQAVSPALWDTVLIVIKQFKALRDLELLIKGIRAINALADALEGINHNFRFTRILNLTAGEDYTWQLSIWSVCRSSCVAIGGHAAMVDVACHITDVTITPQFTPQPMLFVQPTQLDFGSARRDTTLSKDVVIGNSGTAQLNWTANSNRNWITLNRSDGSISPGSGDIVRVAVSTSGLNVGENSGAVQFTSNGGNQDVSIIVNIVENRGLLTLDANRHDNDAHILCTIRKSDGAIRFQRRFYTETLPFSVEVQPHDRAESFAFSDSEKWRCTRWTFDENGSVQEGNGNSLTIRYGDNITVSGIATAFFERRYVISGRVTDFVTGNGVAGVDVRAESGIRTNFRGEYSIGYRDAGPWTVTVNPQDGYESSPASYIVNLPPDATNINFTVRETTPPPAPEVTSITNPFQDRWSKNSNPSLSWSVPLDPSGIAEFAYQANARADYLPNPATDPRTTANEISLSGVTSGLFYFHVRAQDRAGNWGSAGHYALRIDLEKPGVVGSLASQSHRLAEWSKDESVDLSWQQPADSYSGLFGYSILWNHEPASIPPATVENEQNAIAAPITAVASPSLEDGEWFFHIRAVDNAGNWSDNASHIGPFFIDTAPPGITGAHALDESHIRLDFNDTLTPAPATTETNYSIDNGINVFDAVLSDDQRKVTLMTSALDRATQYTVTVSNLTDKANNQIAPRSSVAVSLPIQCTDPKITTTELPPGTVGSPYHAVLLAEAGTRPYNWSKQSGTLPPGINIDTKGVLSGTPKDDSEGTYDFVVRVSDSCSEGPRIDTQPLTLSISTSLAAINLGPVPENIIFSNGTRAISFTGKISGTNKSEALIWNTATFENTVSAANPDELVGAVKLYEDKNGNGTLDQDEENMQRGTTEKFQPDNDTIIIQNIGRQLQDREFVNYLLVFDLNKSQSTASILPGYVFPIGSPMLGFACTLLIVAVLAKRPRPTRATTTLCLLSAIMCFGLLLSSPGCKRHHHHRRPVDPEVIVIQMRLTAIDVRGQSSGTQADIMGLPVDSAWTVDIKE